MFSSQNSQVSNDAVFIEDTFACHLYTGNGSTQTITNGIDLSTKGGLVWGKNRDGNWSHYLADTAQGTGKFLQSNTTSATQLDSTSLTAFNANGFSIGNAGAFINNNGVNYASWTFRKQPKFFDVVTYTGDGTSNRAVSHNLGSIPACIFLKRTDSATSWFVYHRATGGTPQDNILQLNTTDPLATSAGYWGTTPFTDTEFRVSSFGGFNASGGTYVAYVFAHNAGGFGLTGTDNVISCGSFSTDGSGNATVSLGYEPQWVLIKSSSNADGWQMVDTMRGMAVSNGLYNGDQVLQSQASSAETSGAFVQPSATGFDITYYGSSRTYIYIAIRRGPMKVPTSGTSVFSPVERAGTGTTTAITGLGFTPDIVIAKATNTVRENVWFDRLRGAGQVLSSVNTSSENADANALISFDMNGVTVGADTTYYSGINNNNTGQRYANWFMKRAPSFFDEVCYTGTGSARTVNHNLGVAPELMIVKMRNNYDDWYVYSNALSLTEFLALNTSQGKTSGALWNTAPTSSVFGLSSAGNVNASGYTYVAYLFATCAGVSKVGSYSGTGATQTIDCGFTGGARFVLIKRTNNTGSWYVWDTARGMVSGTDPRLALDLTSAESNANWVYSTSNGFQIVTSDTNVNSATGTYIYLAIA